MLRELFLKNDFFLNNFNNFLMIICFLNRVICSRNQRILRISTVNTTSMNLVNITSINALIK